MNQTRNLFLALEDHQWRAGPGEVPPGQIEVQLIRRTITAGSEPGWVRCEAWVYGRETTPDLVRLEVLAELLPPQARPGVGHPIG